MTSTATTRSGATTPSGGAGGPSLAQDNPLAFVGAAFAAGVVTRTLVQAMRAMRRAGRQGRDA